MFVWYAQPLGVSQNALFVVDIDVVNFDDLKADDIGLWKGTGTKKMHFRVLSSGTIKYSEKNQLQVYLPTIHN